MYRLLSASQDAYIQNKIIKNSRCTNSNVGQAGTIDLFSLYNETYVPSTSGSFSSSNVRELSRGLIKFDYTELQSLTSSILDINNSSFKAFISLKDIYGGQTTPSNFTLNLFPLAKDWTEGRGTDVISYRQLDVCNFLSASKYNTTIVTWSLSGANMTGTLEQGSSVDIWVSGNISNASQSFAITQNFARGDEDLWVDVTDYVSASIAGILPNNGFRISYTTEEEGAEATYFVKRFGSRHVMKEEYRPYLHVQYSGERIEDETQLAKFSSNQQTFYVYSRNNTSGYYQNFMSGTSEVSGANCLMLELAASHSIQYTTSSWSISHSASINHLTRSRDSFVVRFTGSQHTIGSSKQTGIYNCSFIMDPNVTASLSAFLSGATEHEFKISWRSLDNSVTYASTYQDFKFDLGEFANIEQRNYATNIINLKPEYQKGEKIRLRVFIQDYDADQKTYKFVTENKSVIVPNMYWRIKKLYTNQIVIPWNEDATKLSYDSDGMYFDFWTSDFDLNVIYQIDFLVKSNGIGKDLFIENPGFIFKVVK